MQWWIILIVVVVLILLWVMSTYNGLVALRNRVKDQWAQIDVLLKRRADLIPNLVETVKGYAKHESGTLEAVINARNKAVSASNVHDSAVANGELTQALTHLFALSESYPELKANTNFMDLQNNLKDTEDKIASMRQFYNDSVLKYQNAIEAFPTSIIAKMLNFKKEEYYEIKAEEKESINVKLNGESK